MSTRSPFTIPGSLVRIHAGRGTLHDLGDLAAAEGARRVLLVTDAGIFAAGHVHRALTSLEKAGLHATLFTGVEENPTTQHVEAGLHVARQNDIDFIVGLGGGSSMDCAKGINFLLSNGGRMQDYKGINKAAKPMLPLIAIPTTAGTGSEAQSFALIINPETHEKMACGDAKALPRIAILDANLLDSCPWNVAAATGIDALSHAVETAGCTRRNEVSLGFSLGAWSMISESLPAMLAAPAEGESRNKRMSDLQLGAFYAGVAIQNSMLGAAHACANPLTAKYGIVHGIAVGLMLPHVVGFNTQNENPYSYLDPEPAHLLRKLRKLLTLADVPANLQHYRIPESDLPALAQQAALQWTATFNPRPVTSSDLLAIYQSAFVA